MPAKRSAPAQRRPEAPRIAVALAVARLSGAEPTSFDLQPTPETCIQIARFMGLHALEAVRLKGDLVPEGKDCWRAKGRLTARVEQRCVLTLEPVPQQIDEPVSRLYVPEAELDAGSELDLDMEEDDPDGYDSEIDLDTLLFEALALALDPYPRADGAELAAHQSAPPGVDPLTDEALRPFAKLEALRAKLSGNDP